MLHAHIPSYCVLQHAMTHKNIGITVVYLPPAPLLVLTASPLHPPPRQVPEPPVYLLRGQRSVHSPTRCGVGELIQHLPVRPRTSPGNGVQERRGFEGSRGRIKCGIIGNPSLREEETPFINSFNSFISALITNRGTHRNTNNTTRQTRLVYKNNINKVK